MTTRSTVYTRNIPPAVRDARKPKTRFPRKACDCHAHIFRPGDLADMLLDWVLDEAQRHKMLVQNPQRV